MAEEMKRIDFLVEELEDADLNVRVDALELLAEIGDIRAIGPIIKTLKDEDYHVREAAALSLGTFDYNSTKLLIKLLKDKNDSVRYAGALSLSIIGDESAIPSLEKAACDKNQVVQKVATLAVSEIKKRI